MVFQISKIQYVLCFSYQTLCVLRQVLKAQWLHLVRFNKTRFRLFVFDANIPARSGATKFDTNILHSGAQFSRTTNFSPRQNEQRVINLFPYSLYIRKYPIRFTLQLIAVNLACKIVISKLLENIEDFVTSLWFGIVLYTLFITIKY